MSCEFIIWPRISHPSVNIFKHQATEQIVAKLHMHYENMPIQKHRLWVLVRTTSVRRFNEYPQSMFLSRNKKNNEYPCKPQFNYIKVGFKGVKII